MRAALRCAAVSAVCVRVTCNVTPRLDMKDAMAASSTAISQLACMRKEAAAVGAAGG